MKLNVRQFSLLMHLANGGTLKAHRNIDGDKVYRLHLLDGSVELPKSTIVDQLKRARYIDSNKKFPAATYLLTDKGCHAVSEFTQKNVTALSTRNYSSQAPR